MESQLSVRRVFAGRARAEYAPIIGTYWPGLAGTLLVNQLTERKLEPLVSNGRL